MSWPLVPLATIVLTAQTGFATGKRDASGPIQVRMNNITRDGRLDFSSTCHVPASESEKSKYSLSNGDVLFNHTNSPNLVGKSTYFTGTDDKVLFSNHILRLRVSDGNDGKYLAYWLTYQFSRGVFEAMCVQWVNQATVRREDLLSLKIPLPPLADQQRIAAILDKADALRHKRRDALSHLDRLLQSVFVEMFGDPVANPKGWSVENLSNLCDGKYGIKAGPFGSSLKKEFFVSSGYRVYGQEQVIAGRFDIGDYYIDADKFSVMRAYEVRANDVLLSLVGTIGKAIIVPEDIEPGIINPRLLKITPLKNVLSSVFLKMWISMPSVQEKLSSVAHGGTMSVLNATLLKTMTVAIPPLTEQQKFAAVVEQVESLRARQVAAQTEVNALFAALQARAFAGEL